jgi:hypothetical protein
MVSRHNLTKALQTCTIRGTGEGSIATMSHQSIKMKLLAASLFTASACGTIALFSCVPIIARMLSDHSTFQVLPEAKASSLTHRAF